MLTEYGGRYSVEGQCVIEHHEIHGTLTFTVLELDVPPGIYVQVVGIPIFFPFQTSSPAVRHHIPSLPNLDAVQIQCNERFDYQLS
jgi:hypothetical protein